MLATLALLCVHDRAQKKNDTLLILAGLTAGCAAWTKNEGLLFLALITPLHFIAIAFTRGWRTCLKQLAFFVIGLAPVVLIIAYFKLQLAPSNVYVADVTSQAAAGTIVESLSGVSKYILVLKVFAKEMLNFGECVVKPVPLLIACLFLAGIKVQAKDKLNIITSCMALCLMMAGYFFLYVRMPIEEIHRVLATTVLLDRLFLQLWPSFIFIYFLVVRTTDEG